MSPKKNTVKRKRVAVKKPTTKKPTEDVSKFQVSVVMYRRIAITFVIIVALVLALVLYLSTVKAVIKVEPVATNISSSTILLAAPGAMGESSVPGDVVVGTLGKTRTFESGDDGKKEVVGVAKGVVTLVNDMSSSQPLVATTRLLSPENVLFRLENAVTVPANGTVTAEVYADQEGAGSDIGATSFTIPGLSIAKQELVYARSDDSMSGGMSFVSVVTQDMIDDAAERLKEELVEDAKDMLRGELTASDLSGELFIAKELEREVGAVFWGDTRYDCNCLRKNMCWFR